MRRSHPISVHQPLATSASRQRPHARRPARAPHGNLYALLAIGTPSDSSNVFGCDAVAARTYLHVHSPRAGERWCWACHACHYTLPVFTGNLHHDLESSHAPRPHSADAPCRDSAGAVATAPLADRTVGRLRCSDKPRHRDRHWQERPTAGEPVVDAGISRPRTGSAGRREAYEMRSRPLAFTGHSLRGRTTLSPSSF